MISYGKQSIDQSDIDTVVEVLKGKWLTQGPAVEIFEKDLQNFFGAKFACAVTNGTAALHLTGLALNWKPGDIILTTPITFLATVNSIIYAGGTPDFVDIDPDTYTIDPNKVEEKIKKYRLKGKNVKAIIGVDFAGHPCDWESLRKIAENHDLKLVNDNCHALGASYFEDKQYAINYADIVIQSYHPVKHFTTGEGGAILTNDTELSEKIKRLRTHGTTKNLNLLEKNDGPWYYEVHELGYNYRITDFQCALGSSQLKKLNKFIDKRRKIAKRYDEAFKNIDCLTIPKDNNPIVNAYHLYPLLINFDKLTINKPSLFKKMKESKVNLQVHYIPIHLQPYYKNKYGFKLGDFSIAENFYLKEVSLPIYPDLSNNDQTQVIRNLIECINV